MKILHTADLHIGKTINGISVLPQQKQALDQIITYLKSNQMDICIIAGDLYERSIPNKEAIKIVNDFLNALINEIQIPTFIISGNHDSAERLSYLSTILQNNQLYIVGDEIAIQSHMFEDFGIHLSSYHDYLQIQNYYQDTSIINADTALRKQLSEIHLHPNLNIFVGHHYFANDNTLTCDSERVLNIGGQNYIDVEVLAMFDYCALGHLHQAQKVTYEKIRYSGSIYKYSESEINHQKSFTVVDLTKDRLHIEKIHFKFDKDVKVITGTFSSLLQQTSDDYVFIHLLDQNVVIDAMQKLSLNYPYALGIQYKNITMNVKKFENQEVEKMSLLQLFEKYFEYTNQKPISPKQKTLIEQLLREE